MVEKFLEFWSHYNVILIQAFFGVVLLMILLLAYRTFFSTQEPTVSGGVSPDLEKILQKIVEQNQKVQPQFGSEMQASQIQIPGEESGNATGDSSGVLSQEAVQKLETELAQKNQEIENLKKQAQSSGSGSGGDKQLKDQIKSLEERLSEYEIIAEDIADLSKFKEENQKLQEELNRIKTSGGSVAANTESPTQAQAVAPEPTPEEVPSPEVVVPVEELVSTPAAHPAEPEMDDLEKEFQALVEAQKAGTLAKSESQAVEETAAPIDLSSAPTPTVEDTQSDIDALLAQHASAESQIEDIETSKPKTEDAQLLGDFEKFIEKKESGES